MQFPAARRGRWRRWLRRGCLFSVVAAVALVVLTVLALVVVLPRLVSEASDILATELTQQVIPAMLVRAEQLEIPPPEVPPRPAQSTRIVPEPFTFSPETPTLIVLVHGATRPPAADNHLGTLAGARAYWGYEFMQALLTGGELQSGTGQPLPPEAWLEASVDPTQPEEQLVLAEGRPAQLAFLSYRDGSDYLGPQTAELINQVYEAYQALFSAHERPPQIVWLAHSMGGLVTRYLLSNPEVSDEAFALGPAERQRAAFLRERTLYVITLSTPHEGSRAADNVGLIEQLLTLPTEQLSEIVTLERDLSTAVLGFLRAHQPSTQHLRSDVWRQLNDLETGLVAPQLARRADGSLIPIYALAGRSPGGGFFTDPNFDFGAELNLLEHAAQTSFHPKLLVDTFSMVLSDYLLYNMPGPDRGWGPVSAGLEPLDRITRTALSPPIEVSYGDAANATFSAFPTYFLAHPWSNLEETITPRYDFTDAVRGGVGALLESLAKSEGIETFLANTPEDSSLAALRQRYDKGGAYAPETGELSDGFIDGDGVVALDSGLGFRLGTDVPDFFSHERVWPVADETLRGSWYRLYDEPYPQDANGNFPWEWANHSFVQYSPEVAGWLAQNVLEQAGPYVGAAPYSGWERPPAP